MFLRMNRGCQRYLLLTRFVVDLLGMTCVLKNESRMSKGVQWLSGRVLDSRLRGRGFEPHRHHCVVVLEQDTFILA